VGAGTQVFPEAGRGVSLIRAAGWVPHPFHAQGHPPPLVPEGWGTLPRSPDTPCEAHLLELERWGGRVPHSAKGVGWGSIPQKVKPGGGGLLFFWRGGVAYEGGGWGAENRDCWEIIRSENHVWRTVGNCGTLGMY